MSEHIGTKESFMEALDLSTKIMDVLPAKPSNMGIPIAAICLAKAKYIEYCRLNLPKEQHEMFENLTKSVEIFSTQIIEQATDAFRASRGLDRG